MNLKILHHRSEEDLDRIKALKAITLELQTPEKKTEMVEKALDSFTLVLNNLGKLRLEVKKGHLTGVRWSGWEVVTSCVECLALANQTYFNKGWGSNYEELLKLKERPRELDEYIVDITTSDDPSEVLRISEQLAYETREIILESQREVAKPDAVESLFKDYYPGLREYVNKINSAVEEKMYIKANNAAAKIQYDLAFCLSRGLTGLSHKDFNLYSELDDVYRKNNFPDLMNSIAPGESESLISKSKEFDEAVQNFFKKHGLSLNYVEGIEDLKRFFERRRKNVD